MLVINLRKFYQYGNEGDLEKLKIFLNHHHISFRTHSEESEDLKDSKDCKLPLKTKGDSKSEFKKKSKQDTESKSTKDKINLKTKIFPFYQDEDIEIALALRPGFSGYVIITPKNLALKDEVYFLNRVRDFIEFIKQQGFLQYSFSQNFNDKSLILFPAPDTGKIFDVNAKIINTLRTFCGSDLQTIEDLLSNFDELPSLASFRSPKQDKRFDSLEYPTESHWKNIDKITRNIGKALLNFTLKEKIAFWSLDSQSSKELSSSQAITFHTPTKEANFKIPDCAFCNKKVIYNQLVLDLGYFVLLLNYRPYVGTRIHFLIVPKHTTDISDLDREQYPILQRIMSAVLESIQANCGINADKIISLVQNGLNSGQTVCGSHIHMMTTPEIFPFLVDLGHQLMFAQQASLTKEQMQAIGKQYKPELYKSLLFSGSPARMSLSNQSYEVQIVKKMGRGNSKNQRKH